MFNTPLYITWDVSPFIYEGEHFAIGWWGTLVCVAYIVVFLIQNVIYKQENIPNNYVYIAVICCSVLGTFFCHCFHCWFYEWYDVRLEEYQHLGEPIKWLGMTFNYRNPTIEHPIELLKIGHGMASHGIDFGMWLGAIITAKILQYKTLWIMDRMIVSRLAFHAISRLGNIFNSEIYGNPTTMPWGFIFVKNGDTLPCHPTAIYESLLAIVAVAIWWWTYTKTDAKKHYGLLTGISALMLWIPRIFIETLKPVQQAFESIFLLNMGQILSLLYIIIASGLVIYSIKQREKNTYSIPSYENKRKKKHR